MNKTTGKTNLTIPSIPDNLAEEYKKIQAEYKLKGMQASVLFTEMFNAWKSKNEDDLI